MLTLISWALLTLLAALQLGDALTTARVLAQGGRELNVVMVRLMALLGRTGALAAKGALVVAIGLTFVLTLPPLAAVVVLAMLCALYVWVVWHNWRLIR